MSVTIAGTTLYCREPERWRKAIETGGLVESQQPETIKVSNGTILPLRWIEGTKGRYADGLLEGGVLDEQNDLVAGLKRSYDDKPVNRTCIRGYEYDETTIEYRDEDVVYGGVLAGAWGHLLVDGTARLWIAKQARERGLKVVFLMIPYQQLEQPELLRLAGLAEGTYEVIEKPTRFRSVTIPATSVFLKSGHFTKRWRETFDTMRETALTDMAERASDRELPKKIYLSRAKYTIQNVVGEAWFERFFVGQGYEPVHLETMPLSEQVATLASAESVATTMGTLSHMAAFCQDGTELIILNRAQTIVDTQAPINRMRDLDCKLVDAFASFLPDRQSTGCPVLLAPGPEWEEFARDRFGTEPDPTYRREEFPAYVVEYVSKWGEFHTDPFLFGKIRDRELREVVAKTNLTFNGAEVDPLTLPEPTKVANLRAEVARLQLRIKQLESANGDAAPAVGTTPLLASARVRGASWEDGMLSIGGTLELLEEAAEHEPNLRAQATLIANGHSEPLCEVVLNTKTPQGTSWTAVTPKRDVADALQRLWRRTRFANAELALELTMRSGEEPMPHDIVPLGSDYEEPAIKGFRCQNIRFGAHLARARWYRHNSMRFDVVNARELKTIVSNRIGGNGGN